ncbi:unnamed protein product [Polarella glacialis]|uniref:GST N-terminal domain-containing protein n=1 Tax=Polarella glacialis TaxID=89957 RepID=A0A813H333_POLGL|nr:unnamed protein product [Polarella glacialis]
MAMALPALRVYGRPSSSNTQKVLWLLHELQAVGPGPGPGRPPVPSFELTLASARLGHGSQLLVGSAVEEGGSAVEEGGNEKREPFGVVDTAWYSKLCPTRTIPCLVDGDLAVWESHSILRYLCQKYAPELHLGSIEGMARCSPWMDWVLGSSFHEVNHHLIDQVARTHTGKRKASLMLEAHEGYAQRLQQAEKQLGETGGFLLGDCFTMADIPLGAEISRWSCSLIRWAQLAAEGEVRPPRQLPALPHLERYFRCLQQRPAYLAGCLGPEREHHQLQPLLAGELQPLFLT